jgi:hypothetical protein
MITVAVDGEVIAAFGYPLDAWEFVSKCLGRDAGFLMRVQFHRMDGEWATRGDFTGFPNVPARAPKSWASLTSKNARNDFLAWSEQAVGLDDADQRGSDPKP